MLIQSKYLQLFVRNNTIFRFTKTEFSKTFFFSINFNLNTQSSSNYSPIFFPFLKKHSSAFLHATCLLASDGRHVLSDHFFFSDPKNQISPSFMGFAHFIRSTGGCWTCRGHLIITRCFVLAWSASFPHRQLIFCQDNMTLSLICMFLLRNYWNFDLRRHSSFSLPHTACKSQIFLYLQIVFK